MKSAQGSVVLCLVALTFGYAPQSDRTVPDGQAVADFDARIRAYEALRNRMAEGAAALDETDDPTEIIAARQALAARIGAARATAVRGDILTAEIAARFRQLLNPEMRGVRGLNNRGIIRDEGPGPGAVSLKVNGEYPEDQPLGSVPTSILERLPPLPEGIEYRFVDKHLILRDARANLIIDYMPNAM